MRFLFKDLVIIYCFCKDFVRVLCKLFCIKDFLYKLVWFYGYVIDNIYEDRIRVKEFIIVK